MAVYAVGDIQGCYDEFQQLLDTIRFTPSVDRLWLVGDLVNRGPDSLGTLRLVKDLGKSAITVLGNHDLHLLALCLGKKTPDISHTLNKILKAPDCDELIDWLRQQPLAHYDPGLDTLMVHAGVPAEWGLKKTLALAGEVSEKLTGPKADRFLTHMYGRRPARWKDSLTGKERLRCITNNLTRLRFRNSKGGMDFRYKGPINKKPKNLTPWFDVPDRALASTRIVFGHWSALGYYNTGKLIGLDTGCVWGNKLTAIRLDSPDAEPIYIPSKQKKAF